ncbi:hypothetical protein AAMO2058_000771600, partial [Amorphochlora amoebiformis]
SLIGTTRTEAKHVEAGGRRRDGPAPPPKHHVGGLCNPSPLLDLGKSDGRVNEYYH